MNTETTTPPSYFDVLNNMPQGTVFIYKETAGGRMIGKGKNKNAVIEVLVDNETFQDFAFQQTYGHPKEGKNELAFIMFAVDADEYQKQLERIKKKMLAE